MGRNGIWAGLGNDVGKRDGHGTDARDTGRITKF